MSVKTKIFIADDHQIVIDAIREHIDTHSSEFDVVGTANDGQEVLDKLEYTEVDILVLDISMPILSGLEVLRIVVDTYPDIKVLVLTMLDEFKYIRDMYKLGAKGYILKNKSTTYVIEALSNIRDGDIFIPEDIARITALDLIPDDTREEKSDLEMIVKSIRDHEAELLGLLTLDLTAKEVADRMHKSTSTIETWKKNLMKKVGAKSAMGLVRFAVENGFKVEKES